MSPGFETSLHQGYAHFLGNRFHEAHQAWEAGCRTARGTEKRLLHVLLLWATALEQDGREDHRARALAVVTRALQRLSEASKKKAPLDTEALRDALVESWAQLSAGKRPVPAAWRPWADPDQPRPIEFTQRALCPYCAEPVLVEVDPGLAKGGQYVEDCPVCCSPWTVTVRAADDGPAISLGRDDD